MGYDFRIGEAVLDAPTDSEISSGDRRAEVRVGVKVLEDDAGCLALYETTYSYFAGFSVRCGLTDLFVDKDGLRAGDALMPDHPGAARLTPVHLARFEAALSAAEKRVANDTMFDAQMLRWLVKWTRLALERCTIPTFYNH